MGKNDSEHPEDDCFEITFKGNIAVVTFHNDDKHGIGEYYRLGWEGDGTHDILFIDPGYDIYRWRCLTGIHQDEVNQIAELIEEKLS